MQGGIGRFEELMLAAVAAGVSAFVHGAAVVLSLTFTAPPDEPPIVFELVSEAPEAEEASLPTAPSPPPTAEPGVDVAETTTDATGGDAASPAEAKSDWRARLAALDREDKDRTERLRRLATALGDADRDGRGGTSVALCGTDGPGQRLDREPERDLRRLAPVMPNGFLPGEYLADIGELDRRRTGTGEFSLEMALPDRVLPIPLSLPEGAVAFLGRPDARCAVRIVVSTELFPIRFERLPVRVVDAGERVSSAVVDVLLDVDAGLRIVKVHEGALPFSAAALDRREHVAARMRGQKETFLFFRTLGAAMEP